MTTQIRARNTTIPTRKVEKLTRPLSDNQPGVEIHVLQGRTQILERQSFARHIQAWTGFHPAPRGVSANRSHVLTSTRNGILKRFREGQGQRQGTENHDSIFDGLDQRRSGRRCASKPNRTPKRIGPAYGKRFESRNRLDGLVYQSEKTIKEKPREAVRSGREGRRGSTRRSKEGNETKVETARLRTATEKRGRPRPAQACGDALQDDGSCARHSRQERPAAGRRRLQCGPVRRRNTNKPGGRN